MNSLLKAVLLLAMTSVVALIPAGGAVAQETEVEFVDEETSESCSPCVSEGEGESHVTALPSGVIVTSCHDELVSNTYHDGTGEVEWDGTVHDGPGCQLVNCMTGDEPHWPASESGELGDGTGHMHLRMCFRNPGTGAELHCDTEVQGAPGGGSHEGTYEIVQLCSGGTRRLEAQGVGLTSGIEAIHHSE